METKGEQKMHRVCISISVKVCKVFIFLEKSGDVLPHNNWLHFTPLVIDLQKFGQRTD